jgi:hypothetical protein
MGLSLRIWRAPEYSLRRRPARPDPRRYIEKPKVGPITPFWQVYADGSSSPNQLLRSFPPLNASGIISVAMTFAAKIPEDMYEEIINHAK